MPLIQQSSGATAIGSAIGSGSSGSVLFVSSGGLLAQDNTNFNFADSTNVLTIANILNSGNGAASTSPLYSTGTIFTGGSATTTFPYKLHSVTGATAVTSWSTSGTFLGLNSASGFVGNFLDLHVNGGASVCKIDYTGRITASYFVGDGSLLTNLPSSGGDVYLANNQTFSGANTFSRNGAVSSPTIVLTGTIYAAGTATTTFPYTYHNVTGASAVTSFSTAGTFLGFNAGSGFAGNFIDCHVNGGASIFSVSSTGGVMASTTSTGYGANSAYQFGSGSHAIGATAGIMYLQSSSFYFGTTAGSTPIFMDTGTANRPGIQFTDTSITRDGAANILAVINGTNAQILRVYKTWSSSGSNYERGVFDWTTTTDVFTIASQAGGTGTLRGLNITAGSNVGIKIGTATTDKLAFYNSAPVAQQTVTGSRGGNAALADLLTKLATLGLIVDSTS